jgi:hypothetical protein
MSVKLARAVEVGLVAALGGVAAWLLAHSLRWPLLHDAPIMHYIAWRIAEGAAPYRDLFDMNFPGVYLFHLAVIKTLGGGDAAWRAVDLAVLAATALLIVALGAPWGRTAAVGGALFFAGYHLAGGAWSTGQRDLLVCPLLLAGALGVVRWAEGGSMRALLGAGVALGVGVTIKPHVGLFVGALAVFVGVRARRTATPVIAPPAVLVVGALLAPAAAVAWVASFGALDAWRDIVFGYLVPLYSRVWNSADWRWLRWRMWIGVAVATLLTLGRLAVTRRFTSRHVVVALGLVYGLVHFLAQRKGWEYHLYPLAAFAAVLLFSELGRALASRPRLAAPALAAALAATVWILGVDGQRAIASARMDSGWVVQKERRVSALAADLAERVSPGQLVQVLDTTDGGIHALLRGHRVQPTRFLYDFHFFHHVDAPAIQRLRRELIAGLADRRPAFVVALRGEWLAGGYARADRFDALAADVGPPPPDDPYRAFPELQDLLARHYRLDRQGDGYRIYAKRDRS